MASRCIRSRSESKLDSHDPGTFHGIAPVWNIGGDAHSLPGGMPSPGSEWKKEKDQGTAPESAATQSRRGQEGMRSGRLPERWGNMETPLLFPLIVINE